MDRSGEGPGQTFKAQSWRKQQNSAVYLGWGSHCESTSVGLKGTVEPQGCYRNCQGCLYNWQLSLLSTERGKNLTTMNKEKITYTCLLKHFFSIAC